MGVDYAHHIGLFPPRLLPFRRPSKESSIAVVSSLGVPGVPWQPHILADQLTLYQPEGTDYAHLFTTGTPGFSDLPTALYRFIFSKVSDSLSSLKADYWWMVLSPSYSRVQCRRKIYLKSTEHQKNTRLFFLYFFVVIWFKVHIFWEGHKILRNLPLTCDCMYCSQK